MVWDLVSFREFVESPVEGLRGLVLGCSQWGMPRVFLGML